MRHGDVLRVHAIEERCFSVPWAIDAYYGEVSNPSAYYLVAQLDDIIVGFGGMWVVEGEAHVVTLATLPEYRRQGIARALMDGLLAEARARRAWHITLEVRVGNEPAKALYTALGFRTIAVRRRYYPDNDEDAAVMALELV
jgi:ribosomal-protein-alanine N-acetyltransferase